MPSILHCLIHTFRPYDHKKTVQLLRANFAQKDRKILGLDYAWNDEIYQQVHLMTVKNSLCENTLDSEDMPLH